MGNEAIFQDEIHLIQKRLKPLIGICLGYELIVRAYSGELIQLPIKEKGVIPLTNIVNSPIFYELPNFNVYESHRWVAKRLPDSLVGLAKSNDGYEVVQHVSKPHMGFQFHPEMCIDRTCGNDIFLNAIHYLGLV
jgi:GMP synthase-like glutamine amidotransferase